MSRSLTRVGKTLSLAVLFSLIFITVELFAFAPKAFADNCYGCGTGVPVGSGSRTVAVKGSQYIWTMVEGQGTAFEQMRAAVKATGEPFPKKFGNNFERTLNGASSYHSDSSMVESCKKSHYIWYATVSPGVNGVRHLWQNGYFDWHAPGWAYWNSTHISTTGWGEKADRTLKKMIELGHVNTNNVYSVICSGDVTPEWNFDMEVVGTDYAATKGVYSYTATVDGKYVPSGGWQAVTPTTNKTEFGKLYDKLNGTNEATYQQLAQTAPQLAEQSKTPGKDMLIDIGDSNAKAVAKGGVLDYSLYAKYATIDGSAQDVYKVSFRKCSTSEPWFASSKTPRLYYDRSGAASTVNWMKTICGSGSVSVSGPTKSYSLKKGYDTPKMVSFWEKIIAHCNEEGMNAVRAKLGGNASSASSDKNTGAVVTKTFTDATQARSSMGGLLGESTGAFAETRDKGFFDKECPFTCTPETSTSSSVPEGSTNVSETGPDMTLFRDNEVKNFTVDRWVPTSSNGVTFDSKQKAVSTTVVVDRNGTPSVTGTDSSGKESGSAKIVGYDSTGKEVKLFGFNKDASDSAANQKNWSVNTKSNLYAATVQGEITSFGARANWASDDGKPVKLNIKWEYQPSVSTPVSVSKSGFSSTAGALPGGANDQVSVPVQGKCYAHFNRPGSDATYTDTTKIFHDNTGSGSTNELDKNIIDDITSQITLTFVRSTTS